mmetsp:Transcript_11079/g.20033  ORF Transcript_11079/g.20033 Transcript_11079/m.20033 type:complete len:213 (-) Transcript_11079:267-905(-)
MHLLITLTTEWIRSISSIIVSIWLYKHRNTRIRCTFNSNPHSPKQSSSNQLSNSTRVKMRSTLFTLSVFCVFILVHSITSHPVSSSSDSISLSTAIEHLINSTVSNNTTAPLIPPTVLRGPCNTQKVLGKQWNFFLGYILCRIQFDIGLFNVRYSMYDTNVKRFAQCYIDSMQIVNVKENQCKLIEQNVNWWNCKPDYAQKYSAVLGKTCVN